MKKKSKTHKSGTKRVYFGGTFDIISWAHCKTLELCKDLGDYLILGLNVDDLVRSYKHREPLYPYYQKKFVLESLKFVDEVIPVTEYSPMSILKELKPEVFVVYKEFIEDHKYCMDYVKSYGGEVHVAPEWEGAVHTSTVKKILLDEMLKGNTK